MRGGLILRKLVVEEEEEAGRRRGSGEELAPVSLVLPERGEMEERARERVQRA
jgi:hypothetical protein